MRFSQFLSSDTVYGQIFDQKSAEYMADSNDPPIM